MAKASAFRALSEAAEADVIPRLVALGTFTRADDTEYGRWNPSPKATYWSHFLRKSDDTMLRLTLWVGAARGTHLQLDATLHAVPTDLEDLAAANLIDAQAPAGFGPKPQSIAVRPSPQGRLDAIISAPSDMLDDIFPANTVIRILAAPFWILALAAGFVASWPMYFFIRTPLDAAQTTARLNARLPRLMRNIQRYAQT